MAIALKPPNMLKNIAIYVDISYVKSFWIYHQCRTLVEFLKVLGRECIDGSELVGAESTSFLGMHIRQVATKINRHVDKRSSE